MKRLLILLANWSIVLTMPVWFGFVMWCIVARDLVKNQSGAREVFAGKKACWGK